MKVIYIEVPEGLHRAAHKIAKARGTTLSALVRQFLLRLVRLDRKERAS